MAHKTLRMVARANGEGYRSVSESEYLSRSARLQLEGVDGDEGTNTVTYWYVKRESE